MVYDLLWLSLDNVHTPTQFILVVLEGAAPQTLYPSISVLVAHLELSFVGGDQWQRAPWALKIRNASWYCLLMTNSSEASTKRLTHRERRITTHLVSVPDSLPGTQTITHFASYLACDFLWKQSFWFTSGTVHVGFTLYLAHTLLITHSAGVSQTKEADGRQHWMVLTTREVRDQEDCNLTIVLFPECG